MDARVRQVISLFLISIYLHSIIYVYTPTNVALTPRPKSGFWAVTEVFGDGRRLMEGFFGRDRYGKMYEERIDWFNSYLDGPRWFNKKEMI